MKIGGHIQLQAELTIDTDEAQVLHLLTSYDLLGWFREHCNKSELNLTAEELKEVLSNLRDQLTKFLTVSEECKKLLTPGPTKKRPT